MHMKIARMNQIKAKRKRLHWKLTKSYIIVAALAFFIIEAVVLFSLFALVGLFPFNEDFRLATQFIVPALTDDAINVSTQYLTTEPPDLAGLQQGLANLYPAIPTTETLSPFENRHFISVFILDMEGHLLASHPQFTQMPADGRLFDGQALGQEAFWNLLLTDLLVLEASPTFTQISTNNAYYVGYGEHIFDETRQPIAATIVLTRWIDPSLFYLGAIGFSLAILLLFTLVAAALGGLFGWQTAGKFSKRLGQLALTTHAWGKGDFSIRVTDAEPDEIGELGTNLNQMATELETLLARQEQFAAFEERNRIARDLHDSVKQHTFAAAAQIGTAKLLLRRDLEQAEIHINQAAELTDQIRLELTALIQQLRPPDVNHKGLSEALRQFMLNWGIQNQIHVIDQISEVHRLETAVEDTLFRFAQEALANVSKHSQATQVTVTLNQTSATINLTIVDNGCGFDVENVTQGVGLNSMQERITAVHGQLTINTQPQKGTTLIVTIPQTS